MYPLVYNIAVTELKPTIKYEDFAKLDIRVGTVLSAEKVDGSSKLIKLSVDFGNDQRTIFTGMQKWYAPEDFVNKQLLFVVNLEPKKMMGMESQGMLLSIGTDFDQRPVFIIPEEQVTAGTGVL